MAVKAVICERQPKRELWSAASEEHSVEIVTEFIELTIYAIVHARSIIPADCFVMNDVGGGYELPRLEPNSSCDAAAKAHVIQSWVRHGVQPAIAKRYLKSATFIVADNEECACEQYTFRLSYPCSESVEISMSGPSTRLAATLAVRVSVIDQLKHIWDDLTLLASGLPRMSDSACIVTMKLSFTSIAPPGYNPPYFRTCAADAFGFHNSAQLALMALGKDGFRGNFHNCKLVYKGPQFDVAQSVQAIEVASDIDMAQAKGKVPVVDADDEAEDGDDDEEDDDTRISIGPQTLQIYGELGSDFGDATKKRPRVSLLPDDPLCARKFKRASIENVRDTEYNIVSSQDSQEGPLRRHAWCREPCLFTRSDLV